MTVRARAERRAVLKPARIPLGERGLQLQAALRRLGQPERASHLAKRRPKYSTEKGHHD